MTALLHASTACRYGEKRLSITHNSSRLAEVCLKSVTINFGASLMDFLHGASG
jgi:hypothetical protein